MVEFNAFMRFEYSHMTSNKLDVIFEGNNMGFLLEPDQYYLYDFTRSFHDDSYPINITSIVRLFSSDDFNSLELRDNKKNYIHNEYLHLYQLAIFTVSTDDVSKIINNSNIELPEDYTIDDILDILSRYISMGQIYYDYAHNEYLLDFRKMTYNNVEKVQQDKVYHMEVIDYSDSGQKTILLNKKYWYRCSFNDSIFVELY